jgi:hypothetical protein
VDERLSLGIAEWTRSTDIQALLEQMLHYGVVDVRIEEVPHYDGAWCLRVYDRDTGMLNPVEEPSGPPHARPKPSERQASIAAHPPLVKAGDGEPEAEAALEEQ